MNRLSIKKTGEVVYYEKLASGLEVYLLPNNKVKNFYMTLNTKFGAIHTDFKWQGVNYHLPKGVAHFLEHLSFNMPGDNNVFDYFAKLGSSINAYTSYEVTSYEVYANSKFKENLSTLLNYVYTPYYTKELVNGEKGIITEEIKMIKDSPNSEIVYGMYRNVFVKDERQYLISGNAEDVKKTTLEDIETAYNAFYHPANMFLIITGNFLPEEALAITTEQLKKFDFPAYSKPILKEQKEPFKVSKAYEEKPMPVDRPKVVVGFKIPRNNFKALKLSPLELRLYINLIMRINFGETSLLKEELVSNAIITDSVSMYLTETEEYLVEAFMASTDYPDYFIKKIENQFQALTTTKDEVARKAKSAISSLIMSFDDIETVSYDIQDDIINYGKYDTDIYTHYRDLNEETAKKVIDCLGKYLTSITVLKPKEENK